MYFFLSSYLCFNNNTDQFLFLCPGECEPRRPDSQTSQTQRPAALPNYTVSGTSVLSWTGISFYSLILMMTAGGAACRSETRDISGLDFIMAGQ